MLNCFSHIWIFAILWTLCDLWTIALQAPLSMGFSWQEYWIGLPHPPPGDLPNPGIEPFSSVTESCPTLCDLMNCSTPGVPVHYQLPEFTQTHVHWVNDAIQPSHPLSSPSPPAPNPSQHQSLFQWVNSLHEVAKVLEFQLQHHSFQRTPRTDLLIECLGWIFFQSKGLSRIFSTPWKMGKAIQCKVKILALRFRWAGS